MLDFEIVGFPNSPGAVSLEGTTIVLDKELNELASGSLVVIHATQDELFHLGDFVHDIYIDTGGLPQRVEEGVQTGSVFVKHLDVFAARTSRPRSPPLQAVPDAAAWSSATTHCHVHEDQRSHVHDGYPSGHQGAEVLLHWPRLVTLGISVVFWRKDSFFLCDALLRRIADTVAPGTDIGKLPVI